MKRNTGSFGERADSCPRDSSRATNYPLFPTLQNLANGRHSFSSPLPFLDQPSDPFSFIPFLFLSPSLLQSTLSGIPNRIYA